MDEPTSTPNKNQLFERWNDWFFAKETPYALALVRILYPLVMLIAVVPRFFHVRELYSTDGSPAPFWWSYGYTNLLPIFSAEVATALYSAMMVLLITASLGWKTRPSLALLTVLVTYFGMLDSLSTLTKYTAFSFHLFLLLSLSNSGGVWSVDAWLARRRSPAWTVPLVEIWPQRLIQLLIGFVYLGSAATKFHTNGFFTGEQMYYWVLTNQNFPNPLGEWISLYPSLLVLGGLMTVVWEVLFLFLVWKDTGRFFVLGMGVFFHLMTYFLLGLVVFPLLFFAAYCCYLRESEAQRIGRFFYSLLPPTPRWAFGSGTSMNPASWPAFGVLLLVTGVGAIAIERRMDVYQERGSQGPITLQPLSQDAVAELLRNDQKLATQDQLYSIDLGRYVVGGFIANPQTQFKAGEEVVMQVRLVPPHQDLWVEYRLQDEHQRIVARDGTLAPREERMTTFRIPLGTQLPPGDYQIQVQLNGIPASRKQITVKNTEPLQHQTHVTQHDPERVRSAQTTLTREDSY